MTDTRDADGRWRVKLSSATVTRRCGATKAMPWVQVFTGGRTVTGPSPLNH